MRTLQRTRLGVYACAMMLDGQGPARALVDSGAACSLLNWRGAKAVGLGRDHPSLQKLSAFGAMGVDGSAMALTHRRADASVAIRPPSGKAIPNSPDLTSSCDVDIGDIPVLGPGSPFYEEGVDGILGTDSLFPGVQKFILDFRAALMYRVPLSSGRGDAGAGEATAEATRDAGGRAGTVHSGWRRYGLLTAA